MKNEELAERMRFALKGESVNSFAAKAGISESLLRKYLAGSQPGLDKAARIAEISQIDLWWLATGRGTPERNKETIFEGDLKEWLEERMKEDPAFFLRFTARCAALFSDFSEWLKKKESPMVSGYNQGQSTK